MKLIAQGCTYLFVSNKCKTGLNEHVSIRVLRVLGAGDLCGNGYSIPLWTNKIPGLGPTCPFPGQVFLDSSPKILGLGAERAWR